MYYTPKPMVDSRRFLIVSFLSAIVSLASVVPAIILGVDALQILEFSGLEFTLGVVAFRWWYQPLYRTNYNLCSPLAIVATFAYIYGGPGNCLSFARRDEIAMSTGNWSAFQLPMLAAVVGLFAFDISYRAVSKRLGENLTYPEVRRFSKNGSGAITLKSLLWVGSVTSLFLYLGTKYPLWWQGSLLNSETDNILYQARLALLFTAWAAASARLATARSGKGQLGALLFFAPLFPYLINFLSRSYAVRALACTGIAFLLLRNQDRLNWRTRVSLAAVAIVIFIFLSNFRGHFDLAERRPGSTSGLIVGEMLADNLDMKEVATHLLAQDQGRLAGLEFASAIEGAHEDFGIPWMYGYHNYLVLVRSAPRVLYPGKPTIDPEVAINRHFGQADVDHLTTPLSSGYADFGGLGTVVGFILLGVSLCLLQHAVWKLPESTIVYLGSITLLMNFEQYVFQYPLEWIRTLSIVYVLAMAVNLMSGLLSLLLGIGRSSRSGLPLAPINAIKWMPVRVQGRG